MATSIATMSRHGRLGLAPLTIRPAALAAASLLMLGLAIAPALISQAQGIRSSSPANVQEVFLTGSDEAATGLAGLLDEANIIRGAWGEGPLHFEIDVAATDAEALAFIEGHELANQVRAADGLPPIVLIDVR